MAQLSAELKMERSRSASLNAEKVALRSHLAGIVSRLRPGQLPAVIDPNAAAPGRGAPAGGRGADEVSAAAAALLASSDPPDELGQELGQSLGQSLGEADARLSLDAWGKAAAAQRINSGGSRPGSSAGSNAARTAEAAAEDLGRQQSSEVLNVPITPGRSSEPPVSKGEGEAPQDQAMHDERQELRFAASCGGEDESQLRVAKRGRADSAEDWAFASGVGQ